jgi:hypothetical protein
LKTRAYAAIEKLDTHPKIDRAYREAFAVGFVEPQSPIAVQQDPPHTIDQRKNFLKSRSQAGDDMPLGKFEQYVTNLEAIQ